MDAVAATTMLFNLLAGFGLFFMGIGALWFVTIYKNLRKEAEK